jgi:exosortase A
MNGVWTGNGAGTWPDGGRAAVDPGHPSAERSKAAPAENPGSGPSLPSAGPRSNPPPAWRHGFLIVPAVGYLLWRRMPGLAETSVQPSPRALPLFAALVLCWLLGYLTGVLLVQQVALVMMLQSAFLVLWGREATRLVAFPLFYLFFAVPVGSFLVPPLQDFTARFVVQFLAWTGIPVYSDGWIIQIPAGNFYVAEACAGVRFLISSTALGFLGAYLFYRQFWRRALFVGLSVLIPVIANGFRAYGIVMLGHVAGMEAAAGTDHVVYGFVFLTLVMACLLGLGITFRERGAAQGDAPGAPGAVAPAAERGRAARLRAGAALLGLIALALAGRLYGDHITRPVPGPAAVALSPPRLPAPWMPVASASADWRPRFPGHRAELLQHFSDGARTVHLYMAYYDRQRQGAEVVSDVNKFTDSAGRRWRNVARHPAERAERAERASEGAPVAVQVRRMTLRGRRLLVWSWYWVDGRFTSNPYVAKLLEAKVKLFGGENAAAAISVATAYGELTAGAETTLRAFVQNLDRLRRVLEDAAGQGAR